VVISRSENRRLDHFYFFRFLLFFYAKKKKKLDGRPNFVKNASFHVFEQNSDVFPVARTSSNATRGGSSYSDVVFWTVAVLAV
jgi:hypothetical protein